MCRFRTQASRGVTAPHRQSELSEQGHNPEVEVPKSTVLYLMIQSVVFRGFLRSSFVLNVLHIPTFMEVFRKQLVVLSLLHRLSQYAKDTLH